MGQKIIAGKNFEAAIQNILKEEKIKKYMLVCDGAFDFLPIKNCFDKLGLPYIKFSGFTSNPLYEDVCRGVDIFNSENCDCILAVGGGSTIDVAKCIKLYCRMDNSKNYLTQVYSENDIPLIAVPTTSGTGSESTRYAVIYYNGEKQSVTHESIIPSYAILESSVLKTLPLYQKKCTVLDALCQGIESWWSVNSTDESKDYSRKSIKLITSHIQGYITNNDNDNEQIMLASNLSGRAINITQTTAAHAMSYKLTSLYKLPHGHAVAICLPKVWKYMNSHPDKCIDPRGSSYLSNTFQDIAHCLGADNVSEAIDIFNGILSKLDIKPPVPTYCNELKTLAASVNPIRLKNNPIELDSDTLLNLYSEILNIPIK